MQTAHAEGHATADQLASIQHALTGSGFAAMKSSYTPSNDGCEMVMSDQPGVKITVSDATASMTMDFCEGCRGAAADAVRPLIEQLAQRIDEALQSAPWIGKPDAAVERWKRPPTHPHGARLQASDWPQRVLVLGLSRVPVHFGDPHRQTHSFLRRAVCGTSSTMP